MTQAQTMIQSDNLTAYYQTIQKTGKLRTPEHAQRWSKAVLYTLALNLDRGAKKRLAGGLPEELARQLKRPFWLLHFRDKSLTRLEFQKMVARRAGNTDAQFARYPVQATFLALKSLVDSNVSQTVANSLSPELREMWQNA
jgi:uncharacterized protein (DUF2267 family)